MNTYTEKYKPNTWKHINPYGEWLSTFKWKYIATLRPYWRINENTGETYFNKLIRLNAVESLFYVTEPDEANFNNYHIHMLINIPYLDEKVLMNLIGHKKNTKIVNYLTEVRNNEAVSHYCSKGIGKGALAHNFYNKKV